MRPQRFFNPGELGVVDSGPALIQLYGQPVAVGDGQIGSDVVANGNGDYGESASREQCFELLTRFAAGGQDGRRLSAKRVNDTRRVDPASARRIFGRDNVCPVFERQTIDGNGAIDSGVN